MPFYQPQTKTKTFQHHSLQVLQFLSLPSSHPFFSNNKNDFCPLNPLFIPYSLLSGLKFGIKFKKYNFIPYYPRRSVTPFAFLRSSCVSLSLPYLFFPFNLNKRNTFTFILTFKIEEREEEKKKQTKIRKKK